MTVLNEQARTKGIHYAFVIHAMVLFVMLGMLITVFLAKDVSVRCSVTASAVAGPTSLYASAEARKPPALIDSEVVWSMRENREVPSTAPTEVLIERPSREDAFNVFMTNDSDEKRF